MINLIFLDDYDINIYVHINVNFSLIWLEFNKNLFQKLSLLHSLLIYNVFFKCVNNFFQLIASNPKIKGHDSLAWSTIFNDCENKLKVET